MIHRLRCPKIEAFSGGGHKGEAIAHRCRVKHFLHIGWSRTIAGRRIRLSQISRAVTLTRFLNIRPPNNFKGGFCYCVKNNFYGGADEKNLIIINVFVIWLRQLKLC